MIYGEYVRAETELKKKKSRGREETNADKGRKATDNVEKESLSKLNFYGEKMLFFMKKGGAFVFSDKVDENTALKGRLYRAAEKERQNAFF